MKVRTGLLMLAVATGTVWAQTTPTSAPATKPAAAKAQTSAAPAAGATSAKPATTKITTTKSTTTKTTTSTAATPAKTPAAKSASVTAKETKKKVTKKPAAEAPAENVATNVAKAKPAVSASKRDPFVSPVQSRSNGPINCGTGKRCLVVDQTVLQGIVKAPNGMIAVVSNSANKAYFLRENDPVYNGFVMRITPDSVVFREQTEDKFGKKSTREVVKKVNAPVV